MIPEYAQSVAWISVNDVEFSRFSTLVNNLTGIVLKPNRKAMVEARVSRLLRSLNLSSLEDLCRIAEGENGHIERDAIIAAMTTNMTKFSREPHHFQFLRDSIFPKYQGRRQGSKVVKIWSAGCSSGEEAYSAVFSFAEASSTSELSEIQVLGTDIDPIVLGKATQAIYERDAVERAEDLSMSRFFDYVSENQVAVKDEYRKRVRFRRMNLISNYRFKSEFDVIFCRNVAIYFDKARQKELWCMLLRNLSIGGYLIIGHSETLPDSTSLGVRPVSAGVFQRCSDMVLDPHFLNMRGGASSVA